MKDITVIANRRGQSKTHFTDVTTNDYNTVDTQIKCDRNCENLPCSYTQNTHKIITHISLRLNYNF